MRDLMIIAISLFTFSIVNAQTIINTNTTGALEQEKTIWLGIEKFTSANASFTFDVGYVFDEYNVPQAGELTLDNSKLNFKIDAGYKQYVGQKKRFYHGANLGLKKHKYAGEVFAAKGWTEERLYFDSGNTGFDMNMYIMFGTRDYTPINGETILQEVDQTRFSLQYMSGYAWKFNRISLDIFYQAGVEITENKMITGYRSALHPTMNEFPKAPNGLQKYSNFDLDLGIKVGYLLN